LRDFYKKHKWQSILIILGIIVGLYLIWDNNNKDKPVEIPLSEVILLSKTDTFSKMEYPTKLSTNNIIYLTIADNVTTKTQNIDGEEIIISGGDTAKAGIGSLTIKDLQEIGFILPKIYTQTEQTSSNIYDLLGKILPTLLLIGLLFLLMGGSLFGQTGTKFKKSPNTITFNDIGGISEVKDNLKEVVSFLQDKTEYEKIGAKIPRGVLLEGAPGTGKTLLAQAIATEANVPFYYTSGSEFHSMWVGMASMRVKRLFKVANKTASVVFIDEFDSIAHKRGNSGTDVGREWNHTLNQLLTEMDGFKPNSKVIVIAATNRIDVLDSAVLRAGRFDRKISIGLPDYEARGEILKIHSRNKKLSKDVNLSEVAKQTTGFSGADLALLMNESAIMAIKDNKKTTIGMSHIMQALDKVLVGDVKKGHKLTDKERKLLAYHEAGHAIVASFNGESDKVQRITILQHGQAGGFTRVIRDRDDLVLSKTKAINSIAMFLGGRVAEEIVMNEITSAAQDDIKKANLMAREMVQHYGMSGEYGLRYAEQNSMGLLDVSMESSKTIDSGIINILNQANDISKRIINNKRDILDKLANELLLKDTLEAEDIVKIIG
jgi:cell division protease FtsH